MSFETSRDVLTWYEKQPRALTQEFLSSIDWAQVKKFPLDPRFVPVLIYMRDVETLTDIYYSHLRRTPTGKDPIIGKFMERWGTEELLHGEVLHRFLCEAGYEDGDNWQAAARNGITLSYKLSSRVISALTNCVGNKFTAAHMVYGAVNEMSTLQGYRRLIELAKHPILTEILRRVMREEAVHAQFYYHVGRLELERSNFSQKLARFVIKNFYVPVGQGAKPAADANNTITTLFGDREGLKILDKNVTRRIQQLPGLSAVNTVTEKLGGIIKAHQLLDDSPFASQI